MVSKLLPYNMHMIDSPISPQMMDKDEEERLAKRPRLHTIDQLMLRSPSGTVPVVPKLRRQVSFQATCVRYQSTRTIEDVEESWYSNEELASFKNERRRVLRYLKSIHFQMSPHEERALRGYEAYFSLQFNRAVKEARKLLVSLVLEEQARQRMVGYADSQAICFTSEQASYWARNNAFHLGRQDAEESESVLMEFDPELVRKLSVVRTITLQQTNMTRNKYL